MWKITEGQYGEVKEQEGPSWYGKEILLGQEDGIPIYTITNEAVLKNSRIRLFNGYPQHIGIPLI